MTDLMARARALVEANRVALRPTSADRKRVRLALQAFLHARQSPRVTTRRWLAAVILGAIVGVAAGVSAALLVSKLIR